jgi:hypothetical protein
MLSHWGKQSLGKSLVAQASGAAWTTIQQISVSIESMAIEAMVGRPLRCSWHASRLSAAAIDAP